MKLHKSKKDDELYYYFLKTGEKRWMYRHKYYDSLGKRKEKKKSGFTTEKDAYKALLEVRVNTLNGDVGYVENIEMTISKWLDIWFETYHIAWKKKTANDISDAIRLHFKPLIGNYTLRNLNYSTYKRKFINTLIADGYSPNTIRLYHKYFMMAINAAIRDEIIKENKFKNIRIESNRKNDNYLTAQELTQFLNFAEEIGDITQYTLTLLLAYSGMRKGEALGLKWDDVCFKENSVSIKRTRDDLGPRPPKTHHSYRTIKIDPLVIKQLDKYQKWCIEKKLSFGIQHNPKTDFIFINESANPIHDTYINNFFNRIYTILKRRNINLKRITPHGLRHTHATILIDALVSPSDVAYRLGNTIEMIYKVYAHKFKKQNNQAAIIFGDQLKKIY